MKEQFIVCSEHVCKYFDDVESAEEFAKKSAKETGEDTSIYLRIGTMCGRIDLITGGAENAVT